MPTARDRIYDAICAANPDIKGDLMHHLDARGVGDIVREEMDNLLRRRRGRSKYVQGWRPNDANRN